MRRAQLCLLNFTARRARKSIDKDEPLGQFVVRDVLATKIK
jgi:hypothetical protein